MRRVVIVGAVWCSLAGQAAPADAPLPLQVVAVQSEIADHQAIGSKRSGMMCLPAGTLRWGDLARPNQDEMKALVQTAIAGSGGEVMRNRRRDQAAEKLTVTIVSAKLKLCLPWNGIGHAPKGSGSISVRFDAVDAISGAAVGTATIDEPLALDGRDPRASEDVMREALALAVHDFVKQAGS